MIQRLRDYFKARPWLFVVCVIAILVRIPFLSDAFLLRGERDIVLTGESLLNTGKDLYGVTTPLQFSGLDQPSPPFSFYVSALTQVFIPLHDVFTARLPFMLLASLNTLLIYECVRVLTRRKDLALLTTLLFSLSPGYFHTSMLALEMSVAFPLMLGGLIAYASEKRVWGWVLLVASGLAYNGFRPVVPFMMMYLEVWRAMEHGSWKTFFKQCVVIGAVYAVIFGVTMRIVDGDIVRSRGADIAFVNYQDITPRVNFRRTTTTASVLVAQMFDNKYTETLRYMKDVFFEGQGHQYLFMKGDQSALYATTFTGQFFTTSIVLYYLGFVALGVYRKKEHWYMLGWIPIALIPAVMNVDYVSVTNRAMLVSVVFAYVMSLGAVLGYEYLRKQPAWVRRLVLGLLVLSISVEGVYFVYNYAYRRPVTMFESFFEHEKQISHYVIAHPQTVLYDPSPKNIITALAILDTSIDISAVQTALVSLQKNPHKVRIGSHAIHTCPPSGKKDAMYRAGVVISEACLDPEEYEALSYIPPENRLMYKDFSLRTAYFIYSEKPLQEKEK